MKFWIGLVEILIGAQEMEQLSINRRVRGSVPGPCSLHVNLALGEILNPKLLLVCECMRMVRQAVPCMVDSANIV